MLKLSKMTDYAVVLLTHMVRREGVIATTPSLSETTHLPQPTVAKILKTLAHGGLLNAQRGATGGYVLARAPQAISIADIITVMDGPIHLTECAEDDSHECQMSRACAMHGRWNRVNHAVRAALQNVSLYDMALDAPNFMPKPGTETALRE